MQSDRRRCQGAVTPVRRSPLGICLGCARRHFEGAGMDIPPARRCDDGVWRCSLRVDGPTACDCPPGSCLSHDSAERMCKALMPSNG